MLFLKLLSQQPPEVITSVVFIPQMIKLGLKVIAKQLGCSGAGIRTQICLIPQAVITDAPVILIQLKDAWA